MAPSPRAVAHRLIGPAEELQLCAHGAHGRQTRREVRRGFGPAEMEALPERAALRNGEAPLLPCLYALEDRDCPQPTTDPDRAFDDRHGPGIRRDAVRQGAVDLDEVRVDFEQAAERGVPGAEVVHG